MKKRTTILLVKRSLLFAVLLFSFIDAKSQADAGTSQEVCVDNWTLSGSPSNGTWTVVTGSGILANPTLYNTQVSNLNAGINSFRWFVPGETPNADTITLTFNQVFADAGVDSTICGSSISMYASTPANGTGVWTLVAGSGAITDNTFNQTLVTGLSPGQNIFRWTVTNGSCSVIDDVVVTNNTLTTVAGPDQNITQTQTQLSAAAPNTVAGESGNWAIISGMGTVTVPTLYNSFVTGLQNGPNTFRWTVNNGSCTASDDVNITVSLTPPDAGPGQTICTDSTNLNATPASGGYWTLSNNNTGVPTIVSPSVFNTKVRFMDTMYSPYEFIWNVNGQTDTVIIENKSVYASNQTEVMPACDFISLDANQPNTDEQGLWTVNTSAVIANPTLWLTNATLEPGNNRFYWTINNGFCSATDSVDIFSDKIIAEAGPNGESCDNTYNLQGNIPAQGIGSWTIVQGGGNITSISLYNTQITALGVGTTKLNWTITNNGCASVDSVFITNNAVIANAGNGQSVCDSIAFITGNTPAGGAFGDWTPVNTTVYFDDPSINSTTVRSLEIGANLLAWTVAKGSCMASDTVIITNNLVVANAGKDIFTCTSDNIQLNANNPGQGIGYWTVTTGSATFSNTSINNAWVSGLSNGDNILKWEINNIGCLSTDSVIITYNELIAQLDTNYLEICDATYGPLPAQTPNYGKGEIGDWVPVNTPIYFEDHSLCNTTVMGLVPGENKMTWTLFNESCSASDTLTIDYFNPLSAGVGNDINVFFEDAGSIDTLINISAYGNEGTTYGYWTITQGTATLINPDSIATPVQITEINNVYIKGTMGNAGCEVSDSLLIVVGLSFVPGDTVTHLDWTDPNDWANGIVPGENDSVTIYGTQALIDGDTARCNAIYISSGSLFEVRGGGALFVNTMDLSTNNKRFKATGDAELTIAGNGSLRLGYGETDQKGLRIGTGGIITIDNNPNKATGDGGSLYVRGGSIIIEQDAEKASGDGGTMYVRGSVIIEQDAEKSNTLKAVNTTGNNNLRIRSGGSVIIEQDAEKSTGGGGSLSVRGGSIIIEQDAEKSSYAGGSLRVRSGSVIIEQDAEKSSSLKTITSGKLIVRGGSVIIEQDAEKSTYKTEIIAPSTEIYHGQILIGKLSNTKVTGSGLRTGSIIIEQDAEKSTNVDTSLIIKTGGSLSIDENLNKGADYSLLMNSNTYVTFEAGSFIDLDYAQTGNPRPIVVKQNASLLDLNNTNQLNGIFEHLFIQNQNEQFTAPFNSIISDIFTLDANIKYWDEANSDWNDIVSSTRFGYMQGFNILYPTANYLSVTEGILNSGDLNLALDYSQNTNPDQSGWNLCGNPYPSSINFEHYTNATGVAPCIYQYDNISKQYKIYQKGGVALNGGTQYVVPGKAFFIRASNANASLVFNNDMRLHYFPDGSTSTHETPSNFLKLKVENGTYADETVIRFIDAATNDYDENYDAYKLLSPDADVPQLYSTMGTNKSKTAINSLKPSENEATVVPLNFTAGIDGAYKITAAVLNFDNSVSIVLKDLKDNITQDLRTSPEYTFTYSTSDIEDRFEIQFGTGITGIEDLSKELNVNIYSFANDLFIKTFDNKEYQYEIYDLHGKLIKSEKLLKKGLNTIKINSPSNIYIVKVISGNNISQKSISIIN